MKKSRGFTIIELLVVVAIIAVLAAIVLVNVTGYISSGKNAAIKGNMSSILNQSAVVYDSDSDYDNVCGDANVKNALKAADDASGITGGAICQINPASNSTGFCACSPLASAGTYCVDSRGFKGESSTACSSRCTAAGGASPGVCAD